MKTKGLASLFALTTLGLIAGQGFTAQSAQSVPSGSWVVGNGPSKIYYAVAARKAKAACLKAATSQSGTFVKSVPRGDNEYAVCDFTNECFSTDFSGNRGIYRNNRFVKF
jgi:hypothetical protein